MHLFQFSMQNRVRCESPYGFNHPVSKWSTSDWMVAVCGEVGEAANLVKKLNRIRDKIRNKESESDLRIALAKEIADAVIYLDLLATSLGLDLETIVINKFNETSREINYTRLMP